MEPMDVIARRSGAGFQARYEQRYGSHQTRPCDELPQYLELTSWKVEPLESPEDGK